MARRSSHSRLKAEINIVPYIDVMLVLLVIFMVTAPLINQGVEVDLPKAPAETLDTPQQEIEVVVMSVRKDGSCYLNFGSEKAQPVDCKQLAPRRAEIDERLKRAPQPPVLVRADKDVRYEQVIQAMAALKEVGAIKVGLSTAPPDEPPRR
ncbi:MAG: protein TolR [Candidatus Competibacter sp.]|nr:protein TolR [Candidatus Competibacter sp.]MDG4606353.1 protein TolR [Candidatus Contendobacter sp.]HRD49894.1 protein TolR [Candidatus Contendobacter sp.]